MKIYFNKQEVVKAVNLVQKAVPTKSPMSALEGIYIQAIGSTVTLRGCDTNQFIETSFTARVDEEGIILVDAKMFGDVVRKMPNGLALLETTDNNSINISLGTFKVDLLTKDYTEYPQFPDVEKTEERLTIPDITLKTMIKKVLPSIAYNDTRPILTGMLFSVDSGNFKVVGLDGYRLAVAGEALETTDHINRVIPGLALKHMVTFLGDEGSPIELTFTANHAAMTIGKDRLITRLLAGEYLNYKSMIPDQCSLRVTVNVNDFMAAVDRAFVLSKGGSVNLVKLNIEDNLLTISSNNGKGNMKEEVEIEMDGMPMEIGFNPNYILDALRTIEDDRVVLELTSNIAPCIVRPEMNDEDFYLILPIRFNR